MSECPKCGLENRKEAVFCARCGTALALSPDDKSKRHGSRGCFTPGRAILVLLVAFAVAAVLTDEGIRERMGLVPPASEQDAPHPVAQEPEPAEPRYPLEVPDSVESVVYVVDRSGSMFDIFSYVQAALGKSITDLEPEQRFLVIFFADSRPMACWSGLQPADSGRKRSAIYWIDVQIAESKGLTDPGGALTQALGNKPDLIYLLSDGLFPTETLDTIRRNKLDRKTRINTVAFKSRAGEPLLKKIAEEHGGYYQFIDENRMKYGNWYNQGQENGPAADEWPTQRPFMGEPVRVGEGVSRPVSNQDSINVGGITYGGVSNIRVDPNMGLIVFDWNGRTQSKSLSDFGWIVLDDYPALAKGNEAMARGLHDAATQAYSSIVVPTEHEGLRGLVLVNLESAADKAGQYVKAVDAWIEFQKMDWTRPKLAPPSNLPERDSPELAEGIDRLERALEAVANPRLKEAYQAALLAAYRRQGDPRAADLARELESRRNR